MLTVKNLNFERDDRPLLKAIHFTVNPGELLHIQGANGCGKTTLMSILSGRISSEGAVSFNRLAIDEKSSNYQKNICYIGHQLGLSQELTVQENSLLNFQLPTQLNVVNQAMEQFGLYSVRNTLVSKLSAGQKKRTALLRLLLTHAPIWLLDEPFNMLDAHFIALLVQCLNRHLARKGMVIITSHSSIANYFTDYREYAL